MITIHYNENEEMISITDDNGKQIFHGNYWDIPRSPIGIAKILKDCGLKVTLNKDLPGIG